MRSSTAFLVALCILVGGLILGLAYAFLGEIQAGVQEAQDGLRDEIAER